MPQTRSFEGKVALVTGGSIGIGAAVVRRLVEGGARVGILSRRREPAEALAGELGEAAVAIAGDVSSEADVANAVATIAERFNSLDILINNAAIYLQADAGATALADWNEILGVNLTGAFLCTRYALPQLQKTRGNIVNVSSEAGLVGVAGQAAYNVSKAGMIALTRSCAVDFAARGVRVNCVCPGTTWTPMVEAAVNRAGDPTARRRALESARPANRLGTADEIAGAVLYFAGAGSSYATGAVLSIDGGYTAQ